MIFLVPRCGGTTPYCITKVASAAAMTAARHWTKSNAGMDETGATHILLDPTSPVDARVLYVAGFGRGSLQEFRRRAHLGAEE